jgi:hypothetical protein
VIFLHDESGLTRSITDKKWQGRAFGSFFVVLTNSDHIGESLGDRAVLVRSAARGVFVSEIARELSSVSPF